MISVEVTFCVQLGADRCVSEEEIARDFPAYHAALRANDQDYGAIHLRASGQPPVDVDDDVAALVLNFCFLPIPKLLAGQTVEVRYFRYAGSFHMKPTANEIELSGDLIPTARFDRDALLRGLYDCGCRFIRYLSRCKDLTAYASIIESQKTAARAAATALGAV